MAPLEIGESEKEEVDGSRIPTSFPSIVAPKIQLSSSIDLNTWPMGQVEFLGHQSEVRYPHYDILRWGKAGARTRQGLGSCFHGAGWVSWTFFGSLKFY